MLSPLKFAKTTTRFHILTSVEKDVALALILMRTFGAPEALTPRQRSYLNRFDLWLPVISEGQAANLAGESIIFLSRLPEEAPGLTDDGSDPGAMFELATRIISHIPPRLRHRQEQILNFCAAALNGATKIEDLINILDLPSEDVKALRNQTKIVLRDALAVELNWIEGKKQPIFRKLHHQAIDLKDRKPRTW